MNAVTPSVFGSRPVLRHASSILAKGSSIVSGLPMYPVFQRSAYFAVSLSMRGLFCSHPTISGGPSGRGPRGAISQYRWVPEGIACDQSADLDAVCRFGQRHQHGPALPDSTGRLSWIPVEEMVR